MWNGSEVDSLDQTVKVVSEDMGMKLEIKKRAMTGKR